MSRHVVIGTAGHVDHGKTLLVKALTGVDTDRWEEEKRRGITIDLGFASFPLGDTLAASIVDVPGHEDFVRNMLAGATGIDLALLVVAADESVMPQTIEHLAILEFLGVRTGVAAITKRDLVDAAWLELVVADVTERLTATRVRWEAVVPVSAVTGDGLDELRAALTRATAHVPSRHADDLFRLPVDRAFSVAGAGTVVTGTTWSGVVRVGDEVTVHPSARRARVRSIQVHGANQDGVEAGRRAALALTGLPRDAVARGSTVVVGEAWRPTAALDVLLTLLPSARTLGQRSRVRVHLGTAEVLARVTPEGESLAPGTTGAARLRLETPVVARWGDRLVIRSYSPATTIGGAIVADPWPAARPRRPRGLEALLAAEPDRVRAAVRRAPAEGLPREELPVRLGVPPARAAGLVEVLEAEGVRDVQGRLVEADALGRSSSAVEAVLAAHHRAYPAAPGMPLEALRRAVSQGALVDRVLAELTAAGTVTVEGAVARLAAHVPGLEGVYAQAATGVRNALHTAGFEGRTAAELAAASLREPVVSTVLEFFVREGTVTRVGPERYYEAAVLDRMLDVVAAELREKGEIGPSQVRERLGLTRKFSIPLLEWLDAQGYTVRVGDVRRAGPRLTKRSNAP